MANFSKIWNFPGDTINISEKSGCDKKQATEWAGIAKRKQVATYGDLEDELFKWFYCA
jgi:hypothetical protein